MVFNCGPNGSIKREIVSGVRFTSNNNEDSFSCGQPSQVKTHRKHRLSSIMSHEISAFSSA